MPELSEQLNDNQNILYVNNAPTSSPQSRSLSSYRSDRRIHSDTGPRGLIRPISHHCLCDPSIFRRRHAPFIIQRFVTPAAVAGTGLRLPPDVPSAAARSAFLTPSLRLPHTCSEPSQRLLEACPTPTRRLLETCSKPAQRLPDACSKPA